MYFINLAYKLKQKKTELCVLQASDSNSSYHLSYLTKTNLFPIYYRESMNIC
jgi:hypothetical protein